MSVNQALDRTRKLLLKVEDPRTKRRFRIIHLRSAIRILQDEYGRELAELESLNSLKADPAIEALSGGPVG